MPRLASRIPQHRDTILRGSGTLTVCAKQRRGCAAGLALCRSGTVPQSAFLPPSSCKVHSQQARRFSFYPADCCICAIEPWQHRHHLLLRAPPLAHCNSDALV